MRRLERRAVGVGLALGLALLLLLLGLGFAGNASALLWTPAGPTPVSQAAAFGMLAVGMAGLAIHPSLCRRQRSAQSRQKVERSRDAAER
jgi:hypothetical protein